jgi:hypothetical protein
MFQHGIELFGCGKNINIFKFPPLFFTGFTSCRGMRSRIFPEDQYFFSHGLFLLCGTGLIGFGQMGPKAADV